MKTIVYRNSASISINKINYLRLPYLYKQGHSIRADPDPLIRVEGYVYIKTVCINSIRTVACLGVDFDGKVKTEELPTTDHCFYSGT